MDSLQFDTYTSYSDSSAPRTPSPRSEDLSYTHSPSNYKQALDMDAAAHTIFADHGADEAVTPEGVQFWHGMQQQQSAPFAAYGHTHHRGSLLSELYESHEQPNTHEIYMDQQEPPHSGHSDWSVQQEQQMVIQQHHQQQQHQQPHVPMHRRNTFPVVRRDASYNNHFDHNPMLGRQDNLYGEPMPMTADPVSFHGRSGLDEPFSHSMTNSPHGSFQHLDDSVKLEDPSPVIVPSQTAFYRPPSSGAMHPMTMSYLSPHTGLPVQHTDDAASKETQYLRRRCFNCHTTEPPSWRRSTLNPGKIVCNKCGLYERTHLRPRPLRFDELRAGNKARKQTPKGVGSPSPKQKLNSGLVKKEPREFGLVRRSSVSSTASSVHSGSGNSDWDDNVSLYSSGSAPGSGFPSPSVSTFPIPRDPNSSSPPLSGGIRLPNNPLSDIASMQQQQQQIPHSPRKSATAPMPYYNAYPTPPGTANGPSHHVNEFRRGSLPMELMGTGQMRMGSMPDQSTGWQTIQMSDLSPSAEIPRQTAVAT